MPKSKTNGMYSIAKIVGRALFDITRSRTNYGSWYEVGGSYTEGPDQLMTLLSGDEGMIPLCLSIYIFFC